MAFDHKLEADRIDDFNFFSAFVRVPLLIIGGILGVDGSSSSSAPVPASASDETYNINNENENDDNSDTTDNDYYTTTTRINQRRQPSNISSMSRPLQRNSSEYIPDCYNNDDNNNNNNNNNHCMKTPKKTMSWSDESGLPLVAYDESASHHHEPVSPYASSTVITSRILKPTKSVIKRSRSSEDESSSSCQEPSTNILPLSSSISSPSSSSSRYIPNMNPRKGNNGLIVPARPYGSHHHQSKCTENQSNTNGSEMSPQWGWYINTTPPTPELYHSRSSSKSSFSSGCGGGNSGSIKPINEQLDTITSSSRLSCSSNSNSNSNTIVDGNTCQNQVFKNLKNSNAPIHGWTSIPI